MQINNIAYTYVEEKTSNFSTPIKKYNEFYNLFHKVYYSYKIGFRKPHAKAFQLILNENKLTTHEVLFIDDSPQHIEGAKKLGIKTYHLEDNQEVTTLFPDIIL